MPLRKEAPTPRSAAVALRSARSGASAGPLIPLKPGETSLRRQAILTEGEYTSSLSRIIKRDFFPKLDRLKAENAYLTALEEGDAVQIRRALNTLLRIDELENGGPSNAQASRTPVASNSAYLDTPDARSRGEWDPTPLHSSPRTLAPLTAMTSDSTAGIDDEDISSGIDPDLDWSVTDFQARYTSEDNASFEQLLQRDNQIRAQKYILATKAELRAKQSRAELMYREQEEARAGKQLAMQAAEERGLRIEHKAPLLLTDRSAPSKDTVDEPARESVEELLLVDGPRTDDRLANAGVGRWKYTAKNALTFGPQAPQQRKADDKSTTKPSINFRNTDFGEYDDGTQSEEPGSPTSTRIDAAIRRGPVSSSSSSSLGGTDDTPKVNGYGFVSPHSTPVHGPAQSESDLLRIFNSSNHQGDSTDERQFRLPPESKRDQIAARLGTAQNISSPYGTQKYQLPAARSQMQQKQQLTPAARALFDRTTKSTTPGRATPRASLGHTLLSRNKTAAQPLAKRVHDEALTMDALKRQRWTPSPSPIPRRDPGL